MMEKIHKECLSKNRMFLVQNVDYDDIRDCLVQEKIVSNNKDELITKQPTTQEKIRFLLNDLPISGPLAYGAFLKALTTAGRNYSYVIDRLDRTLRGEDPDTMDEEDSLKYPIQEGQTAMDTSPSKSPAPESKPSHQSGGVCSPSYPLPPYTSHMSHSRSAAEVSHFGQSKPVMHHAVSDPSVRGAVGARVGDKSQYSMSHTTYTQLQADGACNSPLKQEPLTTGLKDFSLGHTPYNFLDDLSGEKLKTRPEEKLFGALVPSLPSIDVLGLNLGFTRVKIEQFRNNHPHSLTSQAIEMLSSWRSQQFKKATIKRLVMAYQKSGLPEECYRQQILDYFKEDSDTISDSESECDS